MQRDRELVNSSQMVGPNRASRATCHALCIDVLQTVFRIQQSWHQKYVWDTRQKTGARDSKKRYERSSKFDSNVHDGTFLSFKRVCFFFFFYNDPVYFRCTFCLSLRPLSPHSWSVLQTTSERQRKARGQSRLQRMARLVWWWRRRKALESQIAKNKYRRL